MPEIALTPQTADRFLARFPGRVAVFHTGVSAGAQYDEWERIRRGEVDVVVGSRSALFVPLPDLTLIVVDEEHEWTYKQTAPPPRYHVREVAERYSELTGAVVVYGSATPDVVTASRARDGRYTRLDLPQRVYKSDPLDPASPIQSAPLPAVEIVDMREELVAGNRSIFSRALRRAISEALEAGDQVMLFLNRRGVASMVCRACGEVQLCDRCAVPFTVHQPPQETPFLRCHECNRRATPAHTCSMCGSDRIRPMGAGTQKLEDEVRSTFALARPLRWDRDTVIGREGHRDLLGSLRAR